jgi:hypothetical protein
MDGSSTGMQVPMKVGNNVTANEAPFFVTILLVALRETVHGP